MMRIRLAGAGGMSLIVLGAVVCMGWIARSELLVQVQPGLAAMKFNTAVLFILLGAGVAAASTGFRRWGTALGAACLVFSAAINLQHAIGVSLGLDTLFDEPFTTRPGEIPGRISVYTCTAFLLLGLGLSIREQAHRSTTGQMVSLLACGLVQMLTCAGLIGYATGNRLPILGSTNMALHTALGLLTGSWAVMGLVWPEPNGRRSLGMVMLMSTPAVASALGLAVALFVLTLMPGDGSIERHVPVLPSLLIVAVAACLTGAAILAARVAMGRAASLRAINDQLAAEIVQRKQAESAQRVLVSELDHRVRNTLAQVLSLAESTAQGAGTVEQFSMVFGERVRALSRAHQALAAHRWSDVDLREFLMAVLEPFAAGANPRIRLDGDAVMIPARASTALCMAYYELAANASRHGALAVANGHVDLTWRRIVNGAVRVEVTWQERGGPPPPPSIREGFGLTLIRGMVPHELGGKAELSFEPEGLRCVLSFELSQPKVVGSKLGEATVVRAAG